MYPKRRSKQSTSKPPQRLRLVELFLKRYSISHTEATRVILDIKRQNGGFLKGLKCSVFFKMAGKLIRTLPLKKTQESKKEWKKTCPLCYMRFSKNYNRDRHLRNIHYASSDASVVDSVENYDDPKKFIVGLIANPRRGLDLALYSH